MAKKIQLNIKIGDLEQTIDYLLQFFLQEPKTGEEITDFLHGFMVYLVLDLGVKWGSWTRKYDKKKKAYVYHSIKR